MSPDVPAFKVYIFTSDFKFWISVNEYLVEDIQTQNLQNKNYYNSPVLQFGALPAFNSVEAKIHTVLWEDVDKQMAGNTKLHMSMFQMT